MIICTDTKLSNMIVIFFLVNYIENISNKSKTIYQHGVWQKEAKLRIKGKL